MISGGVVPWWQLSQNGLGNGGQLGHRGRRVRALLKEDFDYAEAVIGGRFNVLDIVDRGRERSFLAVNNSLGDLIGRQSGVTPNHTDDRDIDSGKNIGRRLGYDKRRHQEQQQRRARQMCRGDGELGEQST